MGCRGEGFTIVSKDLSMLSCCNMGDNDTFSAHFLFTTVTRWIPLLSGRPFQMLQTVTQNCEHQLCSCVSKCTKNQHIYLKSLVELMKFSFFVLLSLDLIKLRKQIIYQQITASPEVNVVKFNLENAYLMNC